MEDEGENIPTSSPLNDLRNDHEANREIGWGLRKHFPLSESLLPPKWNAEKKKLMPELVPYFACREIGRQQYSFVVWKGE